MELYIR